MDELVLFDISFCGFHGYTFTFKLSALDIGENKAKVNSKKRILGENFVEMGSIRFQRVIQRDMPQGKTGFPACQRIIRFQRVPKATAKAQRRCSFSLT